MGRKRRRSQLSLETPPAPGAALSTVSPVLYQAPNNSGKVAKQARPPKFKLKEVVTVAPRTWPGINKLGGTGRIVKVHADCRYDVAYVLGGNEKRVEEKYISGGKFIPISERPVKPRDFFYDYDQLKEVLKQSKKENIAGNSLNSPIASQQKRTPATTTSRRGRSSSKKSALKPRSKTVVELLVPKPEVRKPRSEQATGAAFKKNVKRSSTKKSKASSSLKSKLIAKGAKHTGEVANASNLFLKTTKQKALAMPSSSPQPFCEPRTPVTRSATNHTTTGKLKLQTEASQTQANRVASFLEELELERCQLEKRHLAEVSQTLKMKTKFHERLQSSGNNPLSAGGTFADICKRADPCYKSVRKPQQYISQSLTDRRFARLETLLMARQELEIDRLYKAQLYNVENNRLRLPPNSVRRAKSAFSFLKSPCE